MPTIRIAAIAAGAGLLIAGAGSASAATVTASEAVSRSCQAALLPAGAAGVAQTSLSAPSAGVVRAALSSDGDWDVAVFENASGRLVGSSAGFGGTEVATGFVAGARELTVQACRFAGAATAELESATHPATLKSGVGTVSLVEVSTADAKAKRRLQGLGLDLTEHGDRDSIEVVAYGEADRKKLRDAGFEFRTRVADLGRQRQRDRQADAAFAQANAHSELPSGRTSYRRLGDYGEEMRTLAARYPSLVKPITLPHKTWEGRTVRGIEITTNAANVADGKPIFLNMGVHHAREWPSSEHAMEFAHDLLEGYGRDARITDLVNRARTIVIPVVNPDGFAISREADDGVPQDSFGAFDYELKRKNCRPDPSYASKLCVSENPGNWPARVQGVDPNRNYGGLWGGPGASLSSLNDTYRGPGPFSEPEVRNIRDLQSTRTITNLISNHTYSDLLLRPPGTIDIGTPLDEPLLKSLGASMAAENGYANIPSYGLYDTTGGTEDWTFWTAGSIGYTFEIGNESFHPAFERAVVDEYTGGESSSAPEGGRGNREAYLKMLAATADAANHALVTGKAPDDAKLNLRKAFTTYTHDPLWLNSSGTSLGKPIAFEDELSYDLDPRGGAFSWHVNPSTRPIVAGRLGREKTGDPQSDMPLANPDGIPPECPSCGPNSTTNVERIPFTIEGAPFDNGRAAVHIEWTDPNVDWDLYVVDKATGQVVAQSAAFGDADEDAVWLDPVPGEYEAVVINYDQAGRAPAEFDDWTGEVRFQSPPQTTIGPKEAWVLTCTMPDGKTTSREVVVDRGQRVDVGNACKKDKPAA